MSRSISALRLSVGAAILLLFGLFGTWTLSRETPSTPTGREYRLDVLLITIDTLRADALGAYGRPGGTTPAIDALTAAGARFTNAHAHNVVTLPSHANILSGRLPPDHGVHDNAGFRFPGRLDTVATLLKSHGYRTGAFVSAFPLESRFGLARGFDVYDDRFADSARPAFLIQERSGEETVARAQRWLASQGDGRWFCWVHVYEPHFPYSPREPFASRFVAEPYYGEVASADAALAPLLQPILAAGRRGRALVVLTSDHGEALGDHGEATHGVFAYEATLKVPLIIYDPRVLKPVVVDVPARHIDVLPTILDALGLSAPFGLPGRSLLPAASGKEPATLATASITYFESISPSLNRGWAPLDGIIRDGTKYIELPIPELYELRSDSHEAHNLEPSQRARADEMRTLLGQLRGARVATAHTPEGTETRERLRSLGYIVGQPNSSKHYTEADDPKHLIGFDTRLQEIVGLYLEGHVADALARCRALVRERPDSPLSLVYLAQLERESGNLRGGIEAIKKAVALAPENTEGVSLLGAYLTQVGRATEAIDVLTPYARRQEPDVEVLTSLALALARAGRAHEAQAALARARDLAPSNSMLLVNSGTIHLMSGNRAEARKAFEAALAMNPNLARAHSSLGALDIEEGRMAEARAHWNAAATLDPRELDTVLALALSLARDRRAAQARVALEFFLANAVAVRHGEDIDRARSLLASLPDTPR